MIDPQSILIVQILSLILAFVSLIEIIYMVKKGMADWKLFAFPLIFMISLTLFLFERVTVKLFSVDYGRMFEPQNISSWAVMLQFLAAISAFLSIGLAIISFRVNGKNGHSDST